MTPSHRHSDCRPYDTAHRRAGRASDTPAGERSDKRADRRPCDFGVVVRVLFDERQIVVHDARERAAVPPL